MSDPRDDLYLVAALLADLDRVLNPLPLEERGDLAIGPVIPPALPPVTPTLPPARSGSGSAPRRRPSGAHAAPGLPTRTTRASTVIAHVEPPRTIATTGEAPAIEPRQRSRGPVPERSQVSPPPPHERGETARLAAAPQDEARSIEPAIARARALRAPPLPLPAPPAVVRVDASPAGAAIAAEPTAPPHRRGASRVGSPPEPPAPRAGPRAGLRAPRQPHSAAIRADPSPAPSTRPHAPATTDAVLRAPASAKHTAPHARTDALRSPTRGEAVPLSPRHDDAPRPPALPPHRRYVDERRDARLGGGETLPEAAPASEPDDLDAVIGDGFGEVVRTEPERRRWLRGGRLRLAGSVIVIARADRKLAKLSRLRGRRL